MTRTFRLLICCFVAQPTGLIAQEGHGRIAGTVVDSGGAPVAGVLVTLPGASLHSTTDRDGRYVLEHVPAGVYRLRVGVPHVAPLDRLDIIVQSGTTLRVDVQVPSVSSLVQGFSRDDLGSETAFGGDFVRRLPVDDPLQALYLVPGITLRHGEVGIATRPDLAIRGGTPGDAAIYIDGAPARNETFGTPGILLAPNAVERISVLAGVPNAAVGDVRGGVINYLTRAGGGPDFLRARAALRVESDEPLGDGSSVGYNRIEGLAGGALRVLPRLRWFTSASLRGQRADYRGAGAAGQPAYVMGGIDTVVIDSSGSATALPRFVQASGSCDPADNYGYSCTGLRRPFDWSSVIALHGTVAYAYGEGSSVSLTALASGFQQRQFPGADIGDPALYRGLHAWSRLVVVNWSHGLGRWGGGPLRLVANVSVGTDRSIEGPLDPASEVATRNPILGVELGTLKFTGLSGFPFPITEQIIRNIRTNSGLRAPLLDRSDLANAQSGRLNPFGLQSGWPTSGTDTWMSLLSERRWNGRGSVEWVPRPRHQVTAGVDVTRTDLSFYTSYLLRQAFMDAFIAHPRRIGAFASDRMAFGALSVDVGIRFDHFSSDALFPRTPGRTFSHPLYNSSYSAADSDATVYAAYLADTNIWVPAVTHSALSPRLRVGYALAPRTHIRLAYGRLAQTPALFDMLTNTNSDFTFTNAASGFGRDVKYAKIGMIEVGVRHEVGHARIDASVYRKSPATAYGLRSQPFVDPRIPTDTFFISTLTPLSGTHLTGGEVKLGWNASSGFQAWASYAVQRYVEPKAVIPPIGPPIPLRYTINAFSAAADLRAPGQVEAILTLRAVSGLPYTLLVNDGNGTIVPFTGTGIAGRVAQNLNSSRLPWTRTLDLRLSRAVVAGRLAGTVFVDARNLLGFQNTVALFAETGTTTNSRFQNSLLASEFDGMVDEAQDAGALLPNGTTINLQGSCSGWSRPVNCVSLQRVERRFGDGDGLYTLAEQTRALNTFYESFFGSWRFHGPGRTIRLGMELTF